MKQTGCAVLIAVFLVFFALASVTYAQTFLCDVDGTEMQCRFYDVEYATPDGSTVPPATVAPPTWTPYPVPATTREPIYLPSEAHAELFLIRLIRELIVGVQESGWQVQPIATPVGE